LAIRVCRHLSQKAVEEVLRHLPKAIHTFNNSHAKKIGLFHVTC